MDNKLKTYARSLRKTSTEMEKKLWGLLRNRRFSGYKFRRQYVIGYYIVDFVCLTKNLIIELDGGQHSENILYDEMRTTYLVKCGYRVLRFWNNQLIFEYENVMETIYRELT